MKRVFAVLVAASALTLTTSAFAGAPATIFLRPVTRPTAVVKHDDSTPMPAKCQQMMSSENTRMNMKQMMCCCGQHD